MPGPTTRRVLGESGMSLKPNGRVGFDTIPDQLVNKALKQGFTFNILCVGETGLGKSTLIESLFQTKFEDPQQPHTNENVDVKVHRTKLQDGGVDLDLTVVHTTGFGDQLDRTATADGIVAYLDEQFDTYLKEELKTKRDLPSLHDSRVHACLYFLAPTGRSLKSLDLMVMKKLQDKVNIVPIIAKADTITKPELADFKALLRKEFEENSIRLYEPVNDNDMFGPEDLPFAVVTSKDTITVAGETVRVRQYPWGIVEVENEEHSDFIKLRELILRSHMERLRQTTALSMYEDYRHEKMGEMGFVDAEEGEKAASIKEQYEQKKEQHLQELQAKEDEMRQLFVQKVKRKELQLKQAEQEIAKRYEKLQAEHAEAQKALAAEAKALEQSRQQFLDQMKQDDHGKKKKDKKHKH